MVGFFCYQCLFDRFTTKLLLSEATRDKIAVPWPNMIPLPRPKLQTSEILARLKLRRSIPTTVGHSQVPVHWKISAENLDQAGKNSKLCILTI